MYEAFYGFREKPFNLTPDPRFLYLSAKHSEAFAHLEFGLKQRGGFVVITGEVGAGKTTLCRYFLDRLDESTKSAFILYPALGAVELLRSICDDLGIEEHGWTAKEWVDILHRFLLTSRAQDKNIVLVIDEAQNLEPKVLEQIRLISNLETTTEKLIQIVLIGQSELNEILAQTDLRQLAQRITARYHLNPLSREETSDYIRHRLGVAGGAGKISFTPAALRAIHRFSKGTPRIINLVCDRALLAGFVLGRRELDAKIIKRAISELEFVRKSSKPMSWHQSWKVRGALTGLVLAALALAFRPEAQRMLPWSNSVSSDIVATGAEEPAPASKEEDTGSDASVEFEMRLRTLSSDLSRRGAAGAIMELWGVQLGGGVAAFSPGESLRAIARRCGLEVVELSTHFEQLRRLNLPVILEFFHTMRRDTCFAALVHLGEESAVVAFGPEDTARVPLATLEQFWVHRAHVFWKDYKRLGSAGLEDARVLAWVAENLQELGYLAGQMESTEDALQGGLTRFQSSMYLAADGVAGPRTQMALYSASGHYFVPRLTEP